MSIKLSTYLGLFLVLSLTGCGAASDNEFNPISSDDQSPGGIWSGAINENGGSTGAIAFVTEFGEIRIFTDNDEHIIGNLNIDGGTYTASLNDFTSSQNFSSTSGTLVERKSFIGVSNIGDNGVGLTSFSFNYSKFSSLYARGSSLSSISGIYSKTNSYGYTETYVIDSDGDLSGSNSNGCIYSGSSTVLNSNYNMYRFNLSMSSCGDMTGSYTGLGILSDNDGVNDLLVLSLSGNGTAMTFNIPRS